MNVDFSRNFKEDGNPFEFEYERDNLEFNYDSNSNDLNYFSLKMNTPNYISYETKEEFIENFLRIGNPNNDINNKKDSETSPQIKTTTR